MKVTRSLNTLIKRSHPVHAATRILNASASATSVFTRCWVHSTARTSALFRSVKYSGFRSAYATKASNSPGDDPSPSLPLYRKLIEAWKGTPTKWYPIPIAVGALLLVAIQFRRKSTKSQREVQVDKDGREVIKLRGPWQVHVLGALPLRNMSRLWGYVNSLELPIWLRPYSIRIYALVFGCNLEEIEPDDLKQYASLGEFFYRKLKDGARPVDNAILVSPADGKMLHFGRIKGLRVEQVKGMTYSLDALLGVDRDVPGIPSSSSSSSSTAVEPPSRPDMAIVDDREFANVNGIEYTLDQLIGVTPSPTPGTMTPSSESGLPVEDRHLPPTKHGERVDASVVEPERDLQKTLVHDTSVALEMGVRERTKAWGRTVKAGNALFFAVIYLAPGDYHRFHSPTAWVVEKRRHFVGELFSVSPYMAKRLENLFVLNERVALLGRWKYGFFGMVPVGATNVGSIKINFDQALRTNVRGRPPPPGTYSEAVYSAASPILNGQPLSPAQEMGGFCLGSTIVLVFEAPADFEFAVQAGEKVKVGQRLGDIPSKKDKME